MKVGTSVSIRSMRSRRSVSTARDTVYQREYESVKEFELCFPGLCAKYGLGRTVYVKKEYQEETYFEYLQSTETKKRKRTVINLKAAEDTVSKPITEPFGKDTAETDVSEPVEPIDADAIIIAAMHDSTNNFVELFLYKLVEPPRELLKLIGFIARYYHYLKKIKIQLSRLDAYSMYELSKLVKVSGISEIDLDGSGCKAGNYGILFETGRITIISLSRCNINDEVCGIIASKLCFQAPAETCLYSLNLSMNRIMDAGAISLAKALRSNRKLRYLNLSGNRITDVGAMTLLDSLQQFPLTLEENIEKGQRYIVYEKERLGHYYRFLIELKMKTGNESVKSFKSLNKRKSPAYRGGRSQSIYKNKDTKKDNEPGTNASYYYEDFKNRAEILAGEYMGPFYDPFQSRNIKIINGKCYSKGNMVLCHLNLAYNTISYRSVQKLLEVLQYQNNVKALGQLGLIKVLLIGNDLPIACEEYAKIDELLNKGMRSTGGKAFVDPSKRKSRLSAASITGRRK